MIALHEPNFDKQDEEFLLEALRSTWVSSGGPFVERFERAFADYVGVRHAVSAVNGTAAIQLMLEVLKRQRRIDGSFDVLVPTLTFIATANAVVMAGGRPRLLDVGTGSLNITPAEVVRLIEADYIFNKASAEWRSRVSGLPLLAVMPAHIMGWTCDMATLATVCREMHVTLVEDAAEALGSFERDGHHVGRHGLASAFSFNGNKIMTTGGGGMVATNDAEVAAKVRHLATTAKVDSLKYVHDEVGYNYRLVGLLAALGCSQLLKLPARLERKKCIFQIYAQRLSALGVTVHSESYCVGNNWLVNAVFANETLRDCAITALKHKDVQSRPLWTPLHLQPAYQYLGYTRGAFPNAELLWAHTLSLPSSPQLTDDEVILVADIIAATLAEVPTAPLARIEAG